MCLQDHLGAATRTAARAITPLPRPALDRPAIAPPAMDIPLTSKPSAPRIGPLGASTQRERYMVDRPLTIGATGFEPATFRPPAGCATRLRHAPWLRPMLPRSRAG